MEKTQPTSIPMYTLMLCADAQFLGTTRNVLHELHVTPRIVSDCEAAQALIDREEFDVVLVDWREIDNLAEFLKAVRRSKLNPDCVLVAIVRDLLDLKQAFSAGVQFLIHKPASALQIERCLRAAYCATVARRRKQHREPVNVVATVSTRTQPYAEATIVNLSEGGAGLRLDPLPDAVTLYPSTGEELDLRFALPGSEETIHVTGTVVWTTASHCGIRFTYVPRCESAILDRWLTDCVERSLAALSVRLREVCA